MDTSHSYASLFVASLVVVGVLTHGLVPANADGPSNGASMTQGTGLEAQPTTPTNATESPTKSPTEVSMAGTTQPDEVERHLGPVEVTIFLNCSYFEVDVEPTSYEYDLALVYRNETTGQRIPMLAGPFRGSIDDPFGRTDLQLVEVQVRVQGFPPTSQVAPDRCTVG